MRDQDGMYAITAAVASLAEDPYPAEGFHRGLDGANVMDRIFSDWNPDA